MSGFSNQWVEIFRTGNYGPKGDWTAEKLRQVLANFKAAIWKPPAVLGHPEDDSPVMGWVEDLALDGDVLKAKFEKVQPPLEAHVAEGRYPNRSAAFYLDPQGKGPVLRHVGFLGAIPPEVKGLQPIMFSSGEFVAIEFNRERKTMRFNETHGLKVDEGSVALNSRAEAIAGDLRKQDPKLTEFAAFKEALRQARAEFSEAGKN